MTGNSCRLAAFVVFCAIAFASGAQPVNVTHVFSPRAQTKTWGCWATATVMLWEWKHRASTTEETLTNSVHPNYKNLYVADTRGISPAEEEAFYKALKLRVEKSVNPTIQGWAAMLEKSPLSVTVVNNAQDYHALVVIAMTGDGTAAGTKVHYVDPDGGKQLIVPFSEFLKLYEGAAKWPLQIVYWN